MRKDQDATSEINPHWRAFWLAVKGTVDLLDGKAKAGADGRRELPTGADKAKPAP